MKELLAGGNDMDWCKRKQYSPHKDKFYIVKYFNILLNQNHISPIKTFQ